MSLLDDDQKVLMDELHKSINDAVDKWREEYTKRTGETADYTVAACALGAAVEDLRFDVFATHGTEGALILGKAFVHGQTLQNDANHTPRH